MSGLHELELFDPVELADLRQRVVGRLFEPTGPVQIERYTVLEKVGSGGMGVVYAAYDPKLDRRVALKLLHHRAQGEEQSTRLLREAKALAKLAHPNVVTVFDAGEWQDHVYIAMEFLPGPTVTQWVQCKEPSAREVLEAFIGAGQGLAAAHDAGLIHRDFKPTNLMFAADGRIRVLDFGLVRSLDEASAKPEHGFGSSIDLALTQTGAVLGTPAYMAPEQFHGTDLTHLADQFSFAVSLYEMLAGHRPYGGKTPTEVAASIQRDDPIPGLRVGLPPVVERALSRALSRDPQCRYPSMSALLVDLRAGLGTRRLGLTTMTLGLVVAAAVGAGATYAAGDRPVPRVAAAWTHAVAVAEDDEPPSAALAQARELVDLDPTRAYGLLVDIDFSAVDDEAEAAQLRSRAIARGVADTEQPPGVTNFDDLYVAAAAPGVFVLNDKGGAQRSWNPDAVTPQFLDWGSARTTADGRTIVTCCGHDKELAVWDPVTGQRRTVAAASAPGLEPPLWLSADGSHAVWLGDKAHVVRLDDGTTTAFAVDAESKEMFVPTNDGTAVVELDRDGGLWLRSPASGKRRRLAHNISLSHRPVVHDAYVAAVDTQHRLRVWRTDTRAEVKVPASSPVMWSAGSPDQTLWVWTIGDDGPILRRFDPAATRWTDDRLPATEARPAQVVFSRDGRRAVFVREDRVAVVHDLERGISWIPKIGADVVGASFNEDATAIVTFDARQRVRRWPLPWADDVYRSAHGGAVRGIEPSLQGVYSVGDDGRVVLWDPKSWSTVSEWSLGPGGATMSLDAADDGTVVVGHGSTISFKGPGDTSWTTLRTGSQDIAAVAVSPEVDEFLWVDTDARAFFATFDSDTETELVPPVTQSFDAKQGRWTSSRVRAADANLLAFYTPDGLHRGVGVGRVYAWNRSTGEPDRLLFGFLHRGSWSAFGVRARAGRRMDTIWWWEEDFLANDSTRRRATLAVESTNGALIDDERVVFATPAGEVRIWMQGGQRWLSSTLPPGATAMAAAENWVAIGHPDGGMTVLDPREDGR